MTELLQALRGARHEAAVSPALQPLQALLVAGGGGAVGSALVAQVLVPGRFARVQVLATGAVSSTVRAFEPVALPDLAGAGAPALAVVVLERQRHANGRDEVFLQPQPDDLLPLARTLHSAGVRHLVVLVPHAPALLPQALAHGLANLDEGAVAALGFEHLVLLRASQSAGPSGQARAASGLRRVADWWLSQLSWMVPQRQQPLRADALARCVAQLLRLLPQAAPGTRVIAPETLWSWSQAESSEPGGLEAAVAAGLGVGQAGRP